MPVNYFLQIFFSVGIMNYSELNLNESLFKGIDEAGYVECTPVQKQVLEVSLDGSDLYVQSQTGTGKTAAFLVTIMQQLLSGGKSEGKKALVMVPTRELAVQVEEEAKKLGKFSGLETASFYGGVGYENQIDELKKGVDIIVGTPGRIIDLHESKKMDLNSVAYLAIDEADRMFDMGFYPDLRKIVKFLPGSDVRQTMLFSATLNSYVKNLAWEYTKDAKEIVIEADNITVDEIDQELIHVASDDKIPLLLGILQKENPESLIIFCNTKKMCEILSKRLKLNGVKNEFIIGDLPQSRRLKIMDNFKDGKIKCLIATDVAARGIDVNDLAMVVNFDLPNEAENYVHRIGRTARAGKSGKAYSFCSEQDVYSLMPIERYIEKQIPSRLAVQEEFVEDKSRNVYIKLDSEKKREEREQKQKSFSRRSERKQSGKSAGRYEKKSNSNSSAKRRTTDEELAKLSGMTADERMKYYKEKYSNLSKTGSSVSENGGNSKKSSASKNSAKNASSSKNGKSVKNAKNNFSKTGGKKSPKKQNFNGQNKKHASKASAKNNKKTGIFDRIKKFFSK